MKLTLITFLLATFYVNAQSIDYNLKKG